tara:strand:+ start:123 stop:329 length:207 start_codon:yes stop_codon:yes gene_type:complete
MKPGDLVKYKFVTGGSLQRAQTMGSPLVEQGLVLEVHGPMVKVIFPTKNNKIHTFMKRSLILVSECKE